ncbi:hypothetical protein SARC_02995 [Sphaeroforma arctica JP610]|uniref:C2CD3 N-terminal C2 domain-containing protein n=1 Tax=Sphaeroforma arctica JP610 TaxID=667725 RepID=A0A0L0G7C3_9EUKA|nr:hypothetical protein SARC_02995 [Sphaeroforma arctica JP610]KNC84786.1 hypothetical protein SARC_02995 [Sphaeroforma arctica JP610]|eukprot:XP_014158688.1 hypothetical protein SARC_02995 [Sphaeroforma arctica JP610]
MTTFTGGVQRPTRTLPPGCKGPVCASLHLSVSRLVLTKDVGPRTLIPAACVLVHWYDEEKYAATETPLRLLPVCSYAAKERTARSASTNIKSIHPTNSSSPDRVSAYNPLRYTHTYQILCNTEGFTSYLSKHGGWELKVNDQVSGKPIGVVRIPGLSTLTTLSPLIKHYAVRTADRTKVGELTVALHYQPVSPPRTRRAHKKHTNKDDGNEVDNSARSKSDANDISHNTAKEDLDSSENWKTPACVARDARYIKFRDRDRWRISPIASSQTQDSDSSVEPNIDRKNDKDKHSRNSDRAREERPRRSGREAHNGRTESTIPHFGPSRVYNSTYAQRSPHTQSYSRQHPPNVLDNDDGLLRDVLKHFLRNSWPRNERSEYDAYGLGSHRDGYNYKQCNDDKDTGKSYGYDNQRMSSQFTCRRPPYEPNTGTDIHGNVYERYRYPSHAGSRVSQQVWVGFGLCNQPRCTCMHDLLKTSKVRVHLEDTFAYRTDVCLVKPLICLFQVERHELAALAGRDENVLIPIVFTKEGSSRGGRSDSEGEVVRNIAKTKERSSQTVGVAKVDILGLCQSMCAPGDVDATQPTTLYNVHSPKSGKSKARIHVCTAAGSYAHVMRVLYQTSDVASSDPQTSSHAKTTGDSNSTDGGYSKGAHTSTRSDGMGSEESRWARPTNQTAGKPGIGDPAVNDRQCSSNPSVSGVRLVISAISPITGAPLNAKACFASTDEYLLKYRFPFTKDHEVTTTGLSVSANDSSADGGARKATPLIHIHAHSIVVTDAQLKDTMGQSLVFRMWRRHSIDNTGCQEDHFIGSVIVDLSGLSLGIDEISGWYNLCGEHCHVLGQLKIHFHPRYTSMTHLSVPSNLQTSVAGNNSISNHRYSQSNIQNQYKTQNQHSTHSQLPNTATSSIDTRAAMGDFDVAPPSSLSHLYASISVKSESFLAQQLLNNMDDLDKMNKALVALE